MEKLKIEHLGEIILASFQEETIERMDRIDLLEEEFAELAKDKKGVNLLLDFTSVWYISSAVLGKLVLLRNWINAGKGRLKLSGLKRDIIDIFKITKLDAFFDIYESTEEALKTMQEEIAAKEN